MFLYYFYFLSHCKNVTNFVKCKKKKKEKKEIAVDPFENLSFEYVSSCHRIQYTYCILTFLLYQNQYQQVIFVDFRLSSAESCHKRVSVAEGGPDIGEVAAVSGDELVVPEDCGNKTNVEKIAAPATPMCPAGGALTYAIPVASLQVTRGSRVSV